MRLPRSGEAALIDLDLRPRGLIADDWADAAHLVPPELARRGLATDRAAAPAAQDFDLVLADHPMPDR